MYHNHTKLIGKYTTLKGHNSQFVILLNGFLSIGSKINEVDENLLKCKYDTLAVFH
jgi:hypothetical protein